MEIKASLHKSLEHLPSFPDFLFKMIKITFCCCLGQVYYYCCSRSLKFTMYMHYVELFILDSWESALSKIPDGHTRLIILTWYWMLSHSKQNIFFVICLEQLNTVYQIHKESGGLCCLTKGPLTHQKPSPNALPNIFHSRIVFFLNYICLRGVPC